MERSNPTKFWQLHNVRGLLYILIGASVLFFDRFTGQLAQLVGGLLIIAGLCGGIYAVYTLRSDRNYIWELLRSVFDIGFGIALLVFSQQEENRITDTLGFWALLHAFIQAIQAMYIFMLSGIKQPRNVFGNVLHFANILLSGGLAFELLSTNGGTMLFTLISFLFMALGVIIILLGVQQRRTLLINNTA